MSKWKKIDIAPKDGTVVLLSDINKNQRIGRFSKARMCWGIKWEGADWDFYIDFDPQPMFWKHLDESPDPD